MNHHRLALFPASAGFEKGELTIGGCNLADLARQYGTPLYLYDRAELDSAAASYRQTLSQSWPGQWSVTYAGKAFLCGWVARWAQGHHFVVDCTGASEIELCAAAGLGRENILVHGVNKSPEDLAAAVRHAGVIVADNLAELRRLAQMNTPLPDLWLRFLPGLAVETHSYTQTGHSDSKFGLGGEDLLEAVEFCRSQHLPLKGIHFHQGSQFRDPAPLAPAIEAALDLAAQIGFGADWHFSPGGGWGVAYHEDDLPNPSIDAYVRFVTHAVRAGVEQRGLPMPHLHIEPGRSLVARAGVALYRVGTVKRSGGRLWVLIDGGMADNPRHALYGARYSALTVRQDTGSSLEPAWVAGPYCESGDVILEGLPLGGIRENDLLAVPVCGAYHLSMSSNYNGARRPAALVVAEGVAFPILRRETNEDLRGREVW